jgi:hypothetical protein
MPRRPLCRACPASRCRQAVHEACCCACCVFF